MSLNMPRQFWSDLLGGIALAVLVLSALHLPLIA